MSKKGSIENASTRATVWVGTPESLIAHTIVFAASFAFVLSGAPLATVLLVLTTAVSLEAIYLSIFIQMTVNRNTQSLEEVGEDIGEIQEDVKELETGVDEISGDIDKIQEKDAQEMAADTDARRTLEKIEGNLQTLLHDIETLKRTQP